MRNSGATGMKNAWLGELFIERVKHVHAVVYIAKGRMERIRVQPMLGYIPRDVSVD